MIFILMAGGNPGKQSHSFRGDISARYYLKVFMFNLLLSGNSSLWRWGKFIFRTKKFGVFISPLQKIDDIFKEISYYMFDFLKFEYWIYS